MVRTQLQMQGIKKPEVLEAMRRVPRHAFVPDAIKAYAYRDQAMPIGYGATISQPYIVALMTELLDLKPWHKVLEIGTGSGYQAAILAELARDVYSVEIVEELAKRARNDLEANGYGRVQVRHGDGYLGWPEAAPFHRVVITAAPPVIPQALVEQLTGGGRLVAPEGDSPQTQQLMVLDKGADGKVTRRGSIPVIFVPMVPGSAAPAP
ncbi:MAG: protein-L-isoaspartate(D-aspartate) O-methyltransferase [Bryobacterales bacterium]|nr:protein-L-isoaspartate(D-aspartate) O-methyltransferase [Bryobacterales bacterium]